MKLQRIVNRDNGPVGWMHWCPGCEGPHAIYVEEPNPSTGAAWKFNGNTELPDFNPSILVFTEVNGARRTECHYFLHGGQLQFCSDSPHKLSGQSVPLPDFPPAYLEPKTMSKAKKPAADPHLRERSSHVVQAACVTFVAPFTSASPKAETSATVKAVNRDGTVSVVDDRDGTPHENVPVVAPGAPHPANGPFVIGVTSKSAPRARPPAPAKKPLKRKLPPKKKAKK